MVKKVTLIGFRRGGWGDASVCFYCYSSERKFFQPKQCYDVKQLSTHGIITVLFTVEYEHCTCTAVFANWNRLGCT